MPSTPLPSTDPIRTGSALYQLLVLIADRMLESASTPDQSSECLAATNRTNPSEDHDRDVDNSAVNHADADS